MAHDAQPSEQAVSKEFMRRLPLFSGLSEEDLERLYQMASVTSVGPGALLIREGEEGDALYIVIEGELEIIKGLGVREQVIATRGSGEVVGEMALLEQSRRSASARALSDTRLLVIDQAAFRTLLACSSSAAPVSSASCTRRTPAPGRSRRWSGRSRVTPTSTRHRCKRSTSMRAWRPPWSSCATR